MIDKLLESVFFNQWVVLISTSTLLLGLAEMGWRLGIKTRRENALAAENHSGAAQGAVLGLLGLLLGFSFAMAAGRYDARRALVVEEANSIGTTWLRADFLPSPQKEEVKNLLVRYTKLRLEKFVRAENEEAMALVHQEASGIHQQLWKLASDAVIANPSAIAASFITSLNETIDLDSSRVAALRNHVPGAVWLLLFIVSSCGSWASGYGCGSTGIRSSFSQVIFPILIGVVITLIVDIDQPRKGMIGISQQPLQDLLDGIQPSQQ